MGLMSRLLWVFFRRKEKGTFTKGGFVKRETQKFRTKLDGIHQSLSETADEDIFDEWTDPGVGEGTV